MLLLQTPRGLALSEPHGPQAIPTLISRHDRAKKPTMAPVAPRLAPCGTEATCGARENDNRTNSKTPDAHHHPLFDTGAALDSCPTKDAAREAWMPASLSELCCTLPPLPAWSAVS